MIGFFPIQILVFQMLRNHADARRCSGISTLAYLCFNRIQLIHGTFCLRQERLHLYSFIEKPIETTT